LSGGWGAQRKIKPAAMLDYKHKNGVNISFIVRPDNGEFTHLAQQIKQEKNLTWDVL
jgi:hypothetical protein